MALTDTIRTPAQPMRKLTLGGLVTVVAIAIPFLLDGFQVFQATQVLVLAIAIMGLNLLTGFSGQFSLGHGAFFAAGAYVTAFFLTDGSFPYVGAVLIAGAVCFSLGLGFGFPALKLDGIYLALATFSLAVAMPQILKLTILTEWTGGVGGLVLAKPEAPAGIPLDADQWLYFVVLAFAAGLYWLVSGLVSGRTGRAFLAVKDNPLAAQAMGIRVTNIKVLAFGYSAMITGIAGGLSALVTAYVAPDSFTLFLSVNILVGLVVGGVGFIPGAIIGAIFVHFMPTVADGIYQGLQGVIYGTVLIAIMYFAPRGLGGLFRR
ncbi:branched-chain amino acid ABC transporter permease [Agrobacterium tumefaciens]|uniref:branched-chain amino acid ABC transporter permease n=1 Tax=Agrobacterium tumefaciens TaxID=358 RepID=UPI0015747A4A|nr:branched-chain amino acid ABC transporter permease [Agrobacterium tumefaciens]NTE68215.1 branched-chain amino acid ABC transporter permease [Agrobacterium tumefaciens]